MTNAQQIKSLRSALFAISLMSTECPTIVSKAQDLIIRMGAIADRALDDNPLSEPDSLPADLRAAVHDMIWPGTPDYPDLFRRAATRIEMIEAENQSLLARQGRL